MSNEERKTGFQKAEAREQWVLDFLESPCCGPDRGSALPWLLLELCSTCMLQIFQHLSDLLWNNRKLLSVFPSPTPSSLLLFGHCERPLFSISSEDWNIIVTLFKDRGSHSSVIRLSTSYCGVTLFLLCWKLNNQGNDYLLHYFRSFSVGAILSFLFSPLTLTVILGIFRLFRNISRDSLHSKKHSRPWWYSCNERSTHF